MGAWCESHSDIWNHWKLDRLQALIAADLPEGLDADEQRVFLVGSIHALFHFALDNSWRAGDLSKWGDAGIERAAKWRRKPGALVAALRESTFLEGSTIKGWAERAGLLIKKRVDRENANRAKAGLPPVVSERVANGTRAEPERGPTVKEKTRTDQTRTERKDGPSDDAKALTSRLVELMKGNDPKAKIPADLSKWEDEADKLLRIDGRTPGEAGAVLEWCQNHRTESFSWAANIHSMGKFREKFPTLLGQMKAGRSRGTAVNAAAHGGAYAAIQTA